MKTKGYTLIELLVVIAIIGILAAISIPQFALYRERGIRATVEQTARNLATLQEAHYIEKSTYVADCNSLFANSNFIRPNDVDVFCGVSTEATYDAFSITVSHKEIPYTCTFKSNVIPSLDCARF